MLSPSRVACLNMPRAFIESGATCPYFIVCSCIGRGNISKYKKNRVYPTYALVDPALLKSDLFQLNSVCSNSKQICYVLSTDVSLFSELDYFHLLSDFLLPKYCHFHRITQIITLMDHSIGGNCDRAILL